MIWMNQVMKKIQGRTTKRVVMRSARRCVFLGVSAKQVGVLDTGLVRMGGWGANVEPVEEVDVDVDDEIEKMVVMLVMEFRGVCLIVDAELLEVTRLA